MNKENVFAVLDSNIKANRTAMIIVIVVGAILFVTGICFFLFRERDNVTLGSIFSGLGLIFSLIGIISLATKSFEKKTQRIKDILNNDPQHLVWSYVLQQNNRGAVSVNVVMNFRDGKQFHVDQNAIPEKNTTGFMRALADINPAMHVGYSEELEFKFKKRTL